MPGPAPSTTRERAPPEARHRSRREHDVLHGRADLPDRDRLAGLTEREQSLAGRLEIDGRLTGRGVVQHVFDDAVVASVAARPGRRGRRRTPGPRIISSTQRIFWPITTVEKPSGRACARPGSAARCRRRGRRGAPRPVAGSASSTMPARSTADGFTTTVEPGGRVDLAGQGGERVVGQRLADVARLLVAHPHRLDHLVVTARARRVVRAVQHQVAPAEVEQGRGYAAVGTNSALSGSARRSSARSAAAAAWCTSTRFDATPISTLARARNAARRTTWEARRSVARRGTRGGR